MATSPRTFIAIPCPCPPKLNEVLGYLAELGWPLRVIEPDQLHLTLSFLGETPSTRTAEVSRIISRHTSAVHALDVSLRGLGAFPKPHRPSVLWVGVQPSGPVSRLANQLRDSLAEHGFPQETRPFVAHVTIARIKGRPPAGIDRLLAENQDTDFGGVTWDRVIYYQSELNRAGPVYTPLSEHPLGA